MYRTKSYDIYRDAKWVTGSYVCTVTIDVTNIAPLSETATTIAHLKAVAEYGIDPNLPVRIHPHP